MLAHRRPVSLEEAGQRWTVGAARVSMVVAGAAVALGAIAPGVTQHLAVGVLVVGAALGLPHGAVDHLVPFWRRWVDRGPRDLAVVLGAYVALAGLALVVLRLTGAAGLLTLLGLSVLHFGLGDVLPELARRTRGSAARATEIVCRTVARGGSVVVVPLVCWPDQTSRLLGEVAGSPVVVPDPVRWVLATALGACVVVSATLAVGRRQVRLSLEDVLVPTLFVVVPPLAAFGVYFGGWHALRHTARMILEQPASSDDLRHRRVLLPVLRFLGAAALPSLAAAATIVVLAASVAGGRTAVGEGFTVVLALTVPHLLVVFALDAHAFVAGRRPSAGARPAARAARATP